MTRSASLQISVEKTWGKVPTPVNLVPDHLFHVVSISTSLLRVVSPVLTLINISGQIYKPNVAHTVCCFVISWRVFVSGRRGSATYPSIFFHTKLLIKHYLYTCLYASSFSGPRKAWLYIPQETGYPFISLCVLLVTYTPPSSWLILIHFLVETAERHSYTRRPIQATDITDVLGNILLAYSWTLGRRITSMSSRVSSITTFAAFYPSGLIIHVSSCFRLRNCRSAVVDTQRA